MKSFKQYLAEDEVEELPLQTRQDLLWFVVSGTMKLKIPQFNLPAGGSCPSAGACKSKAILALDKVIKKVKIKLTDDTGNIVKNSKGQDRTTQVAELDAYGNPVMINPVKRYREVEDGVDLESDLWYKLRQNKYFSDNTLQKTYTDEDVETIINNVTWTMDEVIAIQSFICYAVLAEIQYGTSGSPLTNRYHNYELLNKCKSDNEMADLIVASIKADPTVNNSNIIRLHTSGDFFDSMYLDAWIKVARALPRVTFYGYTKSIRMVAKKRSSIPKNMRLTASYGGLEDEFIPRSGLNYALVVDSPKMADDIGLPVDVDDEYAVNADTPFAMLIHGQRKGSFLSKLIELNNEWKKNKKANKLGTNTEVVIDRNPLPEDDIYEHIMNLINDISLMVESTSTDVPYI